MVWGPGILFIPGESQLKDAIVVCGHNVTRKVTNTVNLIGLKACPWDTLLETDTLIMSSYPDERCGRARTVCRQSR